MLEYLSLKFLCSGKMSGKILHVGEVKSEKKGNQLTTTRILRWFVRTLPRISTRVHVDF